MEVERGCALTFQTAALLCILVNWRIALGNVRISESNVRNASANLNLARSLQLHAAKIQAIAKDLDIPTTLPVAGTVSPADTSGNQPQPKDD